MMKGMVIEKPPINPLLNYGTIVSWEFRNKITPDKGKYCFRFVLTFANGEQKPMQRGGFKTIKAAEKAKADVISQLIGGNYVPFAIPVKDFYDYWLYYQMKDISYNSFMTYRNIIYNYLLKSWGSRKPLPEISREDMATALNSFPSKSLFDHGCTVLKSSFSYAKANNLIDADPSTDVIAKAKRTRKKKDQLEENIIPGEETGPEIYRVLTAEEVALVLYTAKGHFPQLYLPLLFTITCGVRISEALAVKFSDIDFGKKTLHLKRQVGRTMDSDGIETGDLCTQAVPTKTQSGIRTIPLADFVLDEIILARQKYDTLKAITYDFKDNGYICCQNNGKPYYRSNLYKPYRKLLEMCGIEYIKWHGLRHTYASLLAEDKISMKAISECMGHLNEGFTKKVYVTRKKTVYDGAKEAKAFWKIVQPDDKEVLNITINPEDFGL